MLEVIQTSDQEYLVNKKCLNLQPSLVEVEAENIRKSIIAALQKMTQFMESMRDTAQRIGVLN